MAAAGYGLRTIINLIVDAAVVGTNESPVAVAAMVLKPARQRWHCRPAIGELRDGRPITRHGSLFRRRACHHTGGKERRPAHQSLHPAASISAAVVSDSTKPRHSAAIRGGANRPSKSSGAPAARTAGGASLSRTPNHSA